MVMSWFICHGLRAGGGAGTFSILRYHILEQFDRTICFYYLMESNHKNHFKCIFSGTTGFVKAIYIDSLPYCIVTVRLRGVIFHHGTAELSKPSEVKA